MSNWSVHGNISQNSTSLAASDFHLVRILQLFFYSAIIAVGSIGNALICLAILSRKKRKTSEYFILNLATTDLLTSIVSIPLDIIERLAGYWPYGSFLCKLVYPLQTILISVSVATLLAMSLERHRAIMHPLKPRMKGRKPIFIICIIWVGSTLLVSPYIYVLGFNSGSCVENWPGVKYVKAYTMSVFVVLYVCPLFGITVAYVQIGRRLYRDIKTLQVVMADTEGGMTGRQMLKTRAHRNLRIVKIFVAAVVAFAVCMLPNHVMWVWNDFGSGSDFVHFYDLLAFTNILVYANSCINPFIFGTLQTRCTSCKEFLRGSQDRDDSSGYRRMFSMRVSFTSSSRLRTFLRGTLRGPRSSHLILSSRRGTLPTTRVTLKELQPLDDKTDAESNL
ncbi:neuropeptide FF receptor 1-like [Stylophora pistillata]|uniref:neuropeptide FF receptor 1-like n=1 Tax=Stylophora pistillata TaxID=50429 RepID=UPI000C04B844|nr:neuropeptide FF receptor 1-like [Stylophora pistillata]XP_022784259.1 neuropeptide FF receptor 1-like [Stylophora pistillata]